MEIPHISADKPDGTFIDIAHGCPVNQTTAIIDIPDGCPVKQSGLQNLTNMIMTFARDSCH